LDVVPTSQSQRQVDRQSREESRDGQDAPPQRLPLPQELGPHRQRLALLAQTGIPGGHDRDGFPHRLVGLPQRPPGRAGQPDADHNPSKAPWYFLGLQEILVYFDPWIAGVVLPGLIVGGLCIIPYIDTNPLGNGYYTFKQRKFAITTFLFGFLVLWVALVILGTFMRGPGWMFFYPGEPWDHTKVVVEVNRNLNDIFGITGTVPVAIFGAVVVAGYLAVGGAVFHALFRKTRVFARMSTMQYANLVLFFVLMMSLPIKMFIRLAFNIKYVWITPWFNI